MLALLLTATVFAAAPEEVPFVEPWAELLEAHFEVGQALRPPDEAVERLVDEWRSGKLRTVEVLLDPRWQTDEVFLLDEATLARIHARVELFSLYPFAGTDVNGEPFRCRAAYFGRGRFAFVYERNVAVALPQFKVLGRDRFDLGALNTGRMRGELLTHLRAFSSPARPTPLRGPYNTTLLGVRRAEGRLIITVKGGREVTLDEPQIQAK